MRDRWEAFKAAVREFFSPRWPELDEDVKQSIEEQVRVRQEWVERHRR